MNLVGTGRSRQSTLNPSKFTGDSDILGISRRALEEKLSMWNKFKNTPHGAVTSALADPMLSDIDSQLNTPFNESRFSSMDVYNIKMAELRGARQVWEHIKKYPEILKNRLKEIEKEMGIGEDTKKV